MTAGQSLRSRFSRETVRVIFRYDRRLLFSSLPITFSESQSELGSEILIASLFESVPSTNSPLFSRFITSMKSVLICTPIKAKPISKPAHKFSENLFDNFA
jgi:ABC-type sulfate transport system permease component